MTTALKHHRRVIGVECLGSAYHELRNMPYIEEHLNATLLHICASDRLRMGELNLARDSSSLIQDNVAAGDELKKVPKTGKVREPVVLLPLDQLLPPAENVAVIKVDVQGGEYEVLQGLLQTITRNLPVIGYEDNAQFKKHGKVRSLLTPLGYVCKQVGGDQLCTIPVRRQ